MQDIQGRATVQLDVTFLGALYSMRLKYELFQKGFIYIHKRLFQKEVIRGGGIFCCY